jgi:flagellin
VFLSDGTTGGGSTISTSVGTLTSAGLTLSGDLTSTANSQSELTNITAAIATIASQRGAIGANINRLQAAGNVINAQVQNLSKAEDGIRAADIPAEVANLTKYQILNSTGISALAQANQVQQSVLKLLQ